MSLNTIMQKPSESLHVYVSRYSRLHYAATIKTVQENTDPMRIYHFVANINQYLYWQVINNSSIADKIAEQVWYTLRTLQDAFGRALTLETGLQLAKGVHFGRSPQMIQVYTGTSCHHNGLKGCVHQVNVRIAKQGLWLLGIVEDWSTSKRIARLP